MRTLSPTTLPDPWIPHETLVTAGKMTAIAIGSGTIVATGNDAFYIPVVFPCDATLYALRMAGINALGNYDLGFYDSALTRIASKGSTALSAAIQTLTLPEIRVFGGETYYAAASFSINTAQILRAVFTVAGMSRGVQIGLQASAHPLPNPGVPGSAAASALAPVFAFGVR